MSLVKKLMKEVGADEATAKILLEASNGNYSMAATLYAESQPALPNQGTANDAALAASTAFAPAGDEEVRAPIPPKFDILCPSDFPVIMSSRQYLSQGTSNTSTEHLRDFEHETRAQEAMLGLGRGLFGGRPVDFRARRSGLDGEPGSSSEDGTARDAKKQNLKKLEDLFKPPLDLIFKGSFFMAREEGDRQGQWLLVNIQDNEDFTCHRLNRDVWANANVRKMLQGNFLLWQASHISSPGRKYVQFYPAVTFPYIAVIDSSTGELMSTFQESDPKAFCLFLKSFIARHGRLRESDGHKMRHGSGSRVNEGTEAGCSVTGAGEAAVSETVPLDGSGASLIKRKTSPCPSSPSSADCPTKRRTLMDITEDDQIRMAIEESLRTADAGHDSDGESSRSALSVEGFSDDDLDKEEINYSFENTDQPTSSSSGADVKRARKDNSRTTCSTSTASNSSNTVIPSSTSEWKTAKGNLSNGCSLIPSRSPSPDVSVKACSPAPTDTYSGPLLSLVLRLPDGERETVELPALAPLKCLQSLLRPRGFAPPGYRALTGYPRKDLFALPSHTSLEEAGLLSRDTVILQQE